jgi:hypothetical protein
MFARPNGKKILQKIIFTTSFCFTSIRQKLNKIYSLLFKINQLETNTYTKIAGNKPNLQQIIVEKPPQNTEKLPFYQP